MRIPTAFGITVPWTLAMAAAALAGSNGRLLDGSSRYGAQSSPRAPPRAPCITPRGAVQAPAFHPLGPHPLWCEPAL